MTGGCAECTRFATLGAVAMARPLSACVFGRVFAFDSVKDVMNKASDLRSGDAPLVMAEVELSDATERFALPAWISPLVMREVSEDARYRNSALAMYGVP